MEGIDCIFNQHLMTIKAIYGYFYDSNYISNYINMHTTPQLNKPEILEKIFIEYDIDQSLIVDNKDRFNDNNIKLYIYTKSKQQPHLVYILQFTYIKQRTMPYKLYFIINANNGDVEKYYIESFSITDNTNNEQYTGCGHGGNPKLGYVEYCENKPGLKINKIPQVSNDYSLIYDGKYNTFEQIRDNPALPTPLQCINATEEKECIIDDIEINNAPCAGCDLYHNIQVVWNMFNEWLFGATPIIYSHIFGYVHIGNYDGGAWYSSGSIWIGDGKNHTRYPYTSLDIVAHEIGHGFTEKSSKLIYSSQSGGINEAYSDLVGVAAKYYDGFESDNLEIWEIGGGTYREDGKAIRYMYDPPLDGNSIDNFKTDYKEGMDVHYSSGIYNKAFYLLYKECEWNIKDIFIIISWANYYYWNMETSFNEGVCGIYESLFEIKGDTEQTKLDAECLINQYKSVGVSCVVLPDISVSNIDADDYNDNIESVEFNQVQSIESAEGSSLRYFKLILNDTSIDWINISIYDGIGDADLYITTDVKHDDYYFCDQQCIIDMTQFDLIHAKVLYVILYAFISYQNISFIVEPQIVGSKYEEIAINEEYNINGGISGQRYYYRFNINQELITELTYINIQLRSNQIVTEVKLYVNYGPKIISLEEDTICQSTLSTYINASCLFEVGNENIQTGDWYILIDAIQDFMSLNILVTVKNAELMQLQNDIISVVPLLTRDSMQYFQLTVNEISMETANTTIQWVVAQVLVPSNSNNDIIWLYMKYESPPQRMDYDCRSRKNLSMNAVICMFNGDDNLQIGTYWLWIRLNNPNSIENIEISYREDVSQIIDITNTGNNNDELILNGNKGQLTNYKYSIDDDNNIQLSVGIDSTESKMPDVFMFVKYGELASNNLIIDCVKYQTGICIFDMNNVLNGDYFITIFGVRDYMNVKLYAKSERKDIEQIFANTIYYLSGNQNELNYYQLSITNDDILSGTTCLKVVINGGNTNDSSLIIDFYMKYNEIPIPSENHYDCYDRYYYDNGIICEIDVNRLKIGNYLSVIHGLTSFQNVSVEWKLISPPLNIIPLNKEIIVQLNTEYNKQYFQIYIENELITALTQVWFEFYDAKNTQIYTMFDQFPSINETYCHQENPQYCCHLQLFGNLANGNCVYGVGRAKFGMYGIVIVGAVTFKVSLKIISIETIELDQEYDISITQNGEDGVEKYYKLYINAMFDSSNTYLVSHLYNIQSTDSVFLWSSFEKINSIYGDFRSAHCIQYGNIDNNITCSYDIGDVEIGTYYTTIATPYDIPSMKMKWMLQKTEINANEIIVNDESGVEISGIVGSMTYFYFILDIYNDESKQIPVVKVNINGGYGEVLVVITKNRLPPLNNSVVSTCYETDPLSDQIECYIPYNLGTFYILIYAETSYIDKQITVTLEPYSYFQTVVCENMLYYVTQKEDLESNYFYYLLSEDKLDVVNKLIITTYGDGHKLNTPDGHCILSTNMNENNSRLQCVYERKELFVGYYYFMVSPFVATTEYNISVILTLLYTTTLPSIQEQLVEPAANTTEFQSNFRLYSVMMFISLTIIVCIKIMCDNKWFGFCRSYDYVYGDNKNIIRYSTDDEIDIEEQDST